jgi:phosphohistidine phosphatase
MERKLFIIRHAKSSWDHDGLNDIDRPLAQRGIKNAKEMAERLIKRKTVPDLLLTSPANRALNTALIMSKCWGVGPEHLQIHELLYDARISDIERVISGVPAEIRNLAIYGHNPSFTFYASKFLESPLDNLPTAGVTIVTLESESWDKIGRKNVRGSYVDYPKRK